MRQIKGLPEGGMDCPWLWRKGMFTGREIPFHCLGLCMKQLKEGGMPVGLGQPERCMVV